MAFRFNAKQKEFWELSSKYYQFIGLFFVFIVLIGFYLFVFSSQLEGINEAEAKTKEEELQLEQAQKYLTDLNVLYRNYERFVGGGLERLDTMLPAGENAPDLLVWLESVAQKNGVRLLGIEIIPDEIDETKGANSFAPGMASLQPSFVKKNLKLAPNVKPRSVTISLRLSGGNYEVLKNFLGDVESSLRVMDVLSFSFSPTLENYSMILRAYYLE